MNKVVIQNLIYLRILEVITNGLCLIKLYYLEYYYIIALYGFILFISYLKLTGESQDFYSIQSMKDKILCMGFYYFSKTHFFQYWTFFNRQISYLMMYHYTMTLLYIYLSFQEEAFSVFCVSSLLNSIFFNFFIEVKILEDGSCQTNSSLNIAKNIINRALMQLLCLGYLFITLNSSAYRIKYLILLSCLFLFILIRKKILSTKWLCFYCLENEKITLMTAFRCIGDIISLHLGFCFGNMEDSINEKEQRNKNFENFCCGFQMIIILLQVLLNKLFNKHNSTTVWITQLLHTLLLLSSLNGFKILRWFFSYIVQGPLNRSLLIEEKKLQKLTCDQIYQDYYRITSREKIITLQFESDNYLNSTNNSQFIKNLFLNGKSVQILSQLRNSKNSLEIRSKQRLMILEKAEIKFLSLIFPLLKDSEYKNFAIFIFPNCNREDLQNLMIEHYELLPSLRMSVKNLNDANIIFEKVVQITGIYKYMRESMLFSTAQVVYDLYEDYNTQPTFN